MIFLICSALLFAYFIVKPIFDYLLDSKGLRKYPNFNLLCGITNLGWCLEVWRGGMRSKTLNEKHKMHPVIRVGPNTLSYGDVNAIKDIYGHGTKCMKGAFYEVQKGSHFNLGDSIDKTDHARKRKMFSSAFALKNLEDWEYKVIDKVTSFIQACDNHCTARLSNNTKIPDPRDLTFDFRKWSNLFTIDAIADIALSERLGCLQAGDDLMTGESLDGQFRPVRFREALHAIKLAQTRIAWADEWFGINSKLTKLLPSYRALWATGGGWGDMVYHRVTKRFARYQAGEKLDDLFQSLLEDKTGNPQLLELGEITCEVSVLLDAGSDTTAIALNNVMYWLLKNPRCLARLKEEIDSAVDPETVVVSHDEVKHLPYLSACLDENLRLSPSLGIGLPRVTPPEGAIILNEFVPGNTVVSLAAYVAHRDEKIFTNAEDFYPERWLGDAGKSLQPYFLAFSTGSRGCIGRNISYLEQKVLLATLLHRYEFALPSPGWEQERVEVTNSLPGPLPLKVWRRKRCG